MNRATVNVSGGRVRIEDGNSVIEGKRITLEAGRVLVEGDAAVRAGGNTAKASRVDIRMAPATRPAGER
jgi:lipopolysaccharide export system protein LptA